LAVSRFTTSSTLLGCGEQPDVGDARRFLRLLALEPTGRTAAAVMP
jgi:hypothetical protein